MIPEFVQGSGLGGFLAVISLAGSILIAAGIVHVVFSLLIRYRRRNDQDALGTRMLRASRGPVVLLLVSLGVFLGYLLMTQLEHPTFHFFDRHDLWATKVWLVVAIALASYLGSHIIHELVGWYVGRVPQRTARSMNNRLLAQARWIIPIIIYTIGALTALEVVGIAVTPLMAGLGIGGIAAALALQPALSNVFSGMFMLTEGELNPGDFIELEGGPSGFVVKLSWRSTKIRDRFNNLIMIPNSRMMESVMTNYYSESQAVTIIVQCGVSYDSDLEKVEKVAMEVAICVRDEVDAAIDEYEPLVWFTAFGESNIDFEVRIQAEDRPGTRIVRHELIKRLRTRLAREGIEINYPVRKLLIPQSESPEGLERVHTSQRTLEGGP